MTAPARAAGTTGDVAWERYGGGDGVPLLLLHGLTDAGVCWEPVLGAWAGGRVVLTVDARGHGRTPLADGPLSIARLAADAAAVVRDQLGRPCVVVGHSMGGLVAEELALAAPDLVAALVLEDPAWRALGESGPRGGLDWLPGALAEAATATVAQLAAGSRRDNPQWSEAEHLAWATARSQVDPRLAEAEQVWDPRDWVPALADVRAPVTLLTGDRERGAIVGTSLVAAATAARGGDLEVAHAAGAGHCVRRDAPDVVVEAVLGVLRAADERARA